MCGSDSSARLEHDRANPPTDAVTTFDSAPSRQARPLRVLLATEPGGGGVGRHVIDLATGLTRSGHDVDVVYSPLRADPWFLEALQSLPARTHAIAMGREIRWRDARSALRLHRVIRKFGPFDIAHGHSSKAGALLRLVMPARPTRRIYTPHAFVTLGPDLGPLKRSLYTLSERWLASLSDAVICVSEDERRHAIDLGIDAARLTVINNGIGPMPPADRSSARARLCLAADDVCVGFVGRLTAQKSADRLLEVFHAAYAKHPELRLVIAGDGPDRPGLAQQAKALGIDDRVSFTGDANVTEAMAGFDIFVLPSRYEAFPYVFLEAALRGLPLISTEVGGAAEMIKDGYNGFCVPQAEYRDIADRISQLCMHPRLRAEMGERSAEIAGSFTLQRMVDETVCCYEGLPAHSASVSAQKPVASQ